jgi:hypothetical protein
MATEGEGAELMRMRLVLVERHGHWVVLTVMAPGPLWSAVRGALDRVVESVAWVA